MTDLATKANRLRELHEGFLVLANVWDAPTARIVTDLGFDAVATSSAAMVRALGSEDGEHADPELVFGHLATITAATDLPVSADMERGYGLPPAEFVRRLLDAGAVGCNIEDTDHADRSLRDPREQADFLAAVKQAGRDQGVDIVVNARTDTFLGRAGTGADPLADGLARATAYRAAGADSVYPITLADLGAIRQFVDACEVVNVYASAAAPPLAELRAANVRRISVGSSLHQQAMAAFRAGAAALLAGP
jgi:2-methylisocitrate lyase-like PEP mutase family enzyme